MIPLPPELTPELLAFVAVLAAAAGADLALAVLVLGITPRLGWAAPPGLLQTLQAPAVVLSVLALYGAEWIMERFPTGFALWHAFQRWVRVLGLFLLTSMAVPSLPYPEKAVVVGLATLLGTAVYTGASGWEGILILRRLPLSSQRLSAVAIDVAFGALLVLALEEPLQAAAALGVLLLLASFQLPLAVRAHIALVRAGRARLRALLLAGRWVQEDQLPPFARDSLLVGGAVPGRSLRGARATLLSREIRVGWLVLGPQGPVFVDRRGDPLPLVAPPGTHAVRGPLHIRKPVVAGASEGELLVFKDGPGVEELEQVIPVSVAERHTEDVFR